MFLKNNALIAIACIGLFALSATTTNHEKTVTSRVGWRSIQGRGRFKRNALSDNIQMLLDRTSPFARISNGITLQTGLINGSINFDEAIAEILNFGPVKMSDVTGFKPDTVEALIAKLTEARGTIDSTKETLDAEKQVLAFDKIRKGSNVSEKLEVTKEMQGYFTDVARFSSDFNFDSFTELAGNFTVFSDALVRIQKIPEKRIQQKRFEELAAFSDVIFHSEIILNNMDAVSAELKKYESIQSGVEKLKPFQSFIDIMKSRGKLVAFDKVQSNLKTFLDLVSIHKAAENPLTSIRNLVIARLFPLRADRKHTSGFPNGYSDIEKLMSDLQDSNLQKTLKSPLNQLNDGLKPLLMMPYKITEVNKKFEPFKSPGFIWQLENLVALWSEISVTKEDSENVFTAYKTSVTAIPNTILDPLKTYLNEVKQFSTSISMLSELTTGSEEFKNALKEFRSIFKFADISTPQKEEEEGVIKNLRDNKSLEKFVPIYQKMSEKIKNVTGIDYQGAAKNITQTSLDTFLNTKEVNAELTQQDTIQKLGDSAEQVSMVIRMISQLRDFNKDPKPVSELKTIVAAISEVSAEMKKLGGVVGEMKAMDSSKEVAELNKFKDNNPEAFLKVVHGIHKAWEFLKEKKSLEKLQLADGVLKTEVGKLTDPNLKNEVLSSWGDLKTLEDGMKQMESVNSKLDISKSKSIHDDSKLFKEFKSIRDVAFDGVNKKKALSLLALNNLNTLNDAKESINNLESLDLKFSKFKSSFPSARVAFQNFYSVLGSFLNPDVDLPNQSIGSSTEGAAAAEIDWPKWVIICCGVGLVISLVFGVVAYKKGWCRKPPPNDVEEGDETTPLESITPNNDGDKPKKEEVGVPKEPDGGEKEKNSKIDKGKDEKNKNEKTEIPKTEGTKEKSKEQKVEIPKAEEKKNDKEVKEKPKNEKDSKSSKPVKPKDNTTTDALKKGSKNDEKAGQKVEKTRTETEDAEEAKQDELNPTFVVKDKEKLVKHMKAHSDLAPDDVYKIAFNSLEGERMKSMSHDFVKEAQKILPKEKQRQFKYSPVNKIRVPKDKTTSKRIPIHATEMIGHNKRVVITQAPQKGDKSGIMFDTCDDYLDMIINTGATLGIVIMEMNELEDETFHNYIPKKVGQSLTIGNHQIRLDSETDVFPGLNEKHIITRELQITDKSGKTRALTLYQYIMWPAKNIPQVNHASIYLLFQKVKGTDTPVIVHSMNGTDRAMALVGMFMTFDYFAEAPNSRVMADVLPWLRRFRPGCIRYISMMMWLHMGITYIYIKEHIEVENDRQAALKKYERDYEVMYEMRNNPEKMPEMEKDRREILKKTTEQPAIPFEF
ncbi:hypothetical protein GCK72_003411 [Caenorhabditis remanei]|uniref:Tyrosine-protein phosphatase domain-containing protein n=1 Tax=Caenorhabditis remanei TaxID=31234 RepID=A0A6A5HXA8_CAERE|nr:hypothetical protein GCK72_003411 [Caenorhabditis remanei]KAF1771584.1 hypothetical protein GCK72_003411 [Caenorhabditis remanei]